MPDPAPHGGTIPLSGNPDLARLQEREKALLDEIARLEGMDATKVARAPGGHDLMEVKRIANTHLVEVRRAIEDMKPKPSPLASTPAADSKETAKPKQSRKPKGARK